jgi:hypothetical protein
VPHGDADSRRARAAHSSHSGAWPSSASKSMRSLSVTGRQRPTFQVSEPRIGAWPGIVQPIWPASFQTSLLGVALGMVGVGPRGAGVPLPRSESGLRLHQPSKAISASPLVRNGPHQ